MKFAVLFAVALALGGCTYVTKYEGSTGGVRGLAVGTDGQDAGEAEGGQSVSPNPIIPEGTDAAPVAPQEAPGDPDAGVSPPSGDAGQDAPATLGEPDSGQAPVQDAGQDTSQPDAQVVVDAGQDSGKAPSQDAGQCTGAKPWPACSSPTATCQLEPEFQAVDVAVPSLVSVAVGYLPPYACSVMWELRQGCTDGATVLCGTGSGYWEIEVQPGRIYLAAMHDPGFGASVTVTPL